MAVILFIVKRGAAIHQSCQGIGIQCFILRQHRLGHCQGIAPVAVSHCLERQAGLVRQRQRVTRFFLGTL